MWDGVLGLKFLRPLYRGRRGIGIRLNQIQRGRIFEHKLAPCINFWLYVLCINGTQETFWINDQEQDRIAVANQSDPHLFFFNNTPFKFWSRLLKVISLIKGCSETGKTLLICCNMFHCSLMIGSRRYFYVDLIST